MEGYGVGGLRNQISVKLSDEDYDQLAALAREVDRPMGYLARKWVLAAMKQSLKGERGSPTHPKKGAPTGT